MTKLSPSYREDARTAIPTAIRKYLDAHFLKKLENLTTHNPRLLVVFSGGNAIGKSTLAAKMSTELHGLRLENDAVKRHLLTFDPRLTKDEINTLTWNYTMDLYDRIDTVTPNGLIIRDGVIDWYYDRILPNFIKKGYTLFIAAFDISREHQIELIRSRGDVPTTTADRLITIIDDHVIHQKRFREVYTPDITLTDATLFDHDRVVDAVRTRLKDLT